MTTKCKTCRYRAKLGSGATICNYACETDRLRGCAVEHCDKYKPRRRGHDQSVQGLHED